MGSLAEGEQQLVKVYEPRVAFDEVATTMVRRMASNSFNGGALWIPSDPEGALEPVCSMEDEE